MNELKISDLFWKNYNLDAISANEIVVEVYRESRIEEGDELPCTFIGIHLVEDGNVKEDIILSSAEDFGLFSYTAVWRHRTNMKLAIDIADAMASFMVFGFEIYDFKIKKRFTSNKHIFLLEIPSEYEVTMPEPSEQLSKILEFEIKERELFQKKLTNPDIDISKERNELEKAFQVELNNDKD